MCSAKTCPGWRGDCQRPPQGSKYFTFPGRESPLYVEINVRVLVICCRLGRGIFMFRPGAKLLPSRAGQGPRCRIIFRPEAKFPRHVPPKAKLSHHMLARGETATPHSGQRRSYSIKCWQGVKLQHHMPARGKVLHRMPARGKTAAFTCRQGSKVPYNVPARGKISAPRPAKGKTIASHAATSGVD